MEAKQIPDIQTANSSLRVIEIDPQTDMRWEALMASLPAKPIYHPAWLKVKEEVYGYKPAHLACEDAAGQVVGILPLFLQRGWQSGRTFLSVFTGPLAPDEQITATLLQAAVERTRADPGAKLHLKLMSNAFDNLVDGLVGVPAYKAYLLPLPERPDLLRLDSTIKRAVNKAARLGVEVRQAQTEGELQVWYQLYLQTMHKLFVLPYPYSFYKEAWRQLHSRDMVRLLLAEHVEAGQRRLLGGIFLLLYGQAVSFISVGWREGDQALRPSDMLHWQAIQDACKEGFRWYDFGDVELENEGLARYKSKWGAQMQTVYDYTYPVSHNEMRSTHELSKNRARQLVQTAWPHVPIKTIGLLSASYYALHLY